jgi:hypothetical protein
MRIIQFLLLAVGMSLALVCGIAAHLNMKLIDAEVIISQQKAHIINQELAIDGLSSEVAYLGSEVESLVKQSELVAALNYEHERQSQIITNTGNDWQVNSNKLQVSEHEPTRLWAAEPLPVDALGVLNNASRSQNGDGKTASLHSASSKHDGIRLSFKTF